MKQLGAVLFFALLSTTATAQTYQMAWVLTNFSAGGTAFPLLELDIEDTGRYFAAHGAILTQSRALSPVSGTCARVTTGFFCNLQIDRSSYFMSLDANFNGKISGRDGSGNALPESTATFQKPQ